MTEPSKGIKMIKWLWRNQHSSVYNYHRNCQNTECGILMLQCQKTALHTQSIPFHMKVVNVTCKLLGPGRGLCRGEGPLPWIANIVSVNILALKFSSLIRSCTVSGRRITFPDPDMSKLPSKTSVCVVWDNLRKYNRCSSG